MRYEYAFSTKEFNKKCSYWYGFGRPNYISFLYTHIYEVIAPGGLSIQAGWTSEPLFGGIEEIYFNLRWTNILKSLDASLVPLVFFSLVSGISSLTNMVKLGSIATKTIGLYLFTTGIAVSLALLFGWIFNLSGYDGDYGSFEPATADPSLYGTVLRIFPNNIFGAFVENNMLVLFLSAYYLVLL